MGGRLPEDGHLKYARRFKEIECTQIEEDMFGGASHTCKTEVIQAGIEGTQMYADKHVDATCSFLHCRLCKNVSGGRKASRRWTQIECTQINTDFFSQNNF